MDKGQSAQESCYHIGVILMVKGRQKQKRDTLTPGCPKPKGIHLRIRVILPYGCEPDGQRDLSLGVADSD